MRSLRESIRTLPREAWILFGGSFINRFGSFVMVFLVAWVRKLGYGPAQAGEALAAYGLGHLIASATGGFLADRLGRRSTIVLSMFCSAAAVLALSQARTLPQIIVLATLVGVGAEMYRPAASSLLTDLTPAGERLTAFTLYRLSINLGFAFGPATAGFLAEHSFFYLFLGDAITSVIYGFIALLALPETRPEVQPSVERTGFLRHASRDVRFLVFLLASVAITFVFFQVESSFPLHVLDSGYSSLQYGLLVSLNGVIIIICELPITSVTRRHSPERVMALGFFLVGAAFAIGLFSSTLIALLATILIWTLGEMISAPVSGAFVAELAPAHLRGRYMGAWSLTWSIGLILGPGLGTAIYARSPAALWITCVCLGIFASLIVLAAKRPGDAGVARTVWTAP